MEELNVSTAWHDSLILCGRQWLTSRMFPLPLWAPIADLTDVFPSPQSIVSSTPTYLLRDWSVRYPEFSAPLGGGGLVFEPLPPRALPPSSLFPFCLRHPTHSADYNSNVLCRIPGHRHVLIPSIITPTIDSVLCLEHEEF